MFRYLDEEETQLFLNTFLRISSSETQKRLGRDFDEKSGISYPPYPSGLAVGQLICNLVSIPLCIKNEQVRRIAKAHTTSHLYGLLHFLRDRWGYSPKEVEVLEITNLPSRYKPLGDWYSSTYRLCERVAHYIEPTDGFCEQGSKSVNAGFLMNRCIQEMAINEGLFGLLDLLYPPKDKKAGDPPDTDDKASMRRKKMTSCEHYTKEDYRKYFSYVISRINALEAPTPQPDGTLGYLGTLLLYATQRAGQDREIQTNSMKDFTKASREYLKAILGDESMRLLLSRKGIAGQQKTPKTEFRKLPPCNLFISGDTEIDRKKSFSQIVMQT